MKNLIEQLTALTTDLFYMSESDYDWEVIAEINTSVDEDIEELNAVSFFNKLINEQDFSDEFVQAQAVRYGLLYSFIRNNFSTINIYKTGLIKRQLIIDLETAQHQKIRLRTYSIET